MTMVAVAAPRTAEALAPGKRDAGAARSPLSASPEPAQQQQQQTQQEPPAAFTDDPRPKPRFNFTTPQDADNFDSYESTIEACDGIARSLGMGEIKSNKEYYLNMIKKNGRPKHWKDPHRTDEQLAESMELIRRSGLNTAEVLRMSLPEAVRPPMPDYNAGPEMSDDEEDGTAKQRREPRPSN
ncbi:hypothetical protein JDV02_000761 [Purpureocillium takamizusanense]|uniref:Uncharacterized protein n=1 Tax=Purpureocillium takamizusanense TaxID=2060973 RepID=A0A9Q8V5V4_9HYPO|nr:uncharacterized protein JDV02_000761 [Purpureocillium takamizusanense]UNI14088.1 hypothetical protein JDV02_000761 [Purpureocillium takamizusanense]